MARLILFLLLFTPLCLTGGESGQVSFCLDVIPVFMEEGFLLAGGEAAINYLGAGEEYEQYIGFYSWDGENYENLGAFEGMFSGAFSSGDMIYILESGKGFSRYQLEKGAILFKGFQEAAEGRSWLAGSVKDGTVYVLAYLPAEKNLQVYAVDPEKGGQPVSEAFAVPDEPEDARLIFHDGRPVISWRTEKIKGVGILFGTETGWERRDFDRTVINCYDLAPGPVLYIIGNLDFDHESRIGRSRWQDMAWTAPEPIWGSKMPYAEKYNHIRAANGPENEILLTRTGYLPFGIAGVQVFRHSKGAWRLEVPGLHLMSGMAAVTGLFLAGIALAAAAARKWFPILLFRRVHTIQVGSLLGRVGGYMVDFGLSAVAAVAITGLLRYQDMDALRYSYVLYIVFFICLFLYGLVMELLTGSTIGKLIVGLQLSNRIGMNCTLQQIILRNMVKILEAHMLIVPALAILFSEQNQRLGDIIAGTRVQKKEHYGL